MTSGCESWWDMERSQHSLTPKPHSPDSSDNPLKYAQLPRKNSGELHNSLKPSQYLPTIEERDTTILCSFSQGREAV